MKKGIILIFLLTTLFTVKSFSQVEVKTWKEVEHFLYEEKHEKIRVINFWATWCVPCVKEIPDFEKFYKDNHDKVDLYLINMNAVETKEKVKQFIKRKDLKGTVWLLDEVDFNSWMPKISPRWSGSIPATLILFPDDRQDVFHEGMMNYKSLETIINKK